MELYITLAALSVFLSLTLAFHIYQADTQRRYRYFVLVMISAAVWAFFSIFWLLLSPPWLFIAYKLSFVGVISLPVLLYLASVEYTGKKLLFPGKGLLLWIIPLLSLIMVATNPFHWLFWSDIYPDSYYDGVLMYYYQTGPWYWVHTGYSYMLIVAAMTNMFSSMLKSKKIRLFILVFAGIMVPVVANVLVISGLVRVDYTPIMLSFACVGFGWTILVNFYTENIQNLEKLKGHSEQQNALYEIVVQISEQLIKAVPDEMDQAINQALDTLGRFNGVDRVYIFEYDKNSDTNSNTYEWCEKGITPEKENLQGIPYSLIPRWKRTFDNNEYIYIESVSDLSGEEYQNEKEILEPQGIQSLIVVPMYYGREFIGFMGFDSVRSKKVWSWEIIFLLRMTGNIIAGSIARVRFEKLLIEEKYRAEAANRAKSSFLANMSHEIRTPLNAILGFSRIAADDTKEEETREHLDIVLSSGSSLMRIINDLLDFSKIEAGMLKMRPVETQLKPILEFMRQTFLSQAKEKNVDLLVNISPGADRIFVLDESRLRQILFNLVGNAVKFTPSGRIEISASAEPVNETENIWTVIIGVKDTGIGIAKSDQQVIFEVFNQLSDGDNRRYEGTGLGLNISRRLVELMEGRLELESELGKGSLFRVVLPSVKSQ